MRRMSSSKVPLDLRVVMAIGIFSCIVDLGSAILLMVGIFHVPASAPRPALFGMFVIASDLSAVIYAFVNGLASAGVVLGLWRRAPWGWWYVLVYMVYGVGATAFVARLNPVSATITIVLDISIIVWLLYRRELFVRTRGQPRMAVR